MAAGKLLIAVMPDSVRKRRPEGILTEYEYDDAKKRKGLTRARALKRALGSVQGWRDRYWKFKESRLAVLEAVLGENGLGVPVRIELAAELIKLRPERVKVMTESSLSSVHSQKMNVPVGTIHLLTENNPCKPGANSHLLFGLFKEGMAVAEYCEKARRHKGNLATVNYFAAKGYVEVRI